MKVLNFQLPGILGLIVGLRYDHYNNIQLKSKI